MTRPYRDIVQRPARRTLEARLAEAVETYRLPPDIERAMIARIHGVLSPLLDLVDLPNTAPGHLEELFGSSTPLRARMLHDPEFAMLAHAYEHVAARLERHRVGAAIVDEYDGRIERVEPVMTDPALLRDRAKAFFEGLE